MGGGGFAIRARDADDHQFAARVPVKPRSNAGEGGTGVVAGDYCGTLQVLPGVGTVALYHDGGGTGRRDLSEV